MEKISVVIICKNEERIIGTTLKSVSSVADEIIVYDSGSTDNTIRIAQDHDAIVLQGSWDGYGKNKQKAIAAAKNNWIINIDADEILDKVLQNSIRSLPLDDEKVAYKIRFKNFIGDKSLKWGEFGFDSHVRLFNRKYVNWDDSNIHEQLIIPPDIKTKVLPGNILHYTMTDTREFVEKTIKYALLNAEQYFKNGRRSSFTKQYLAPPFTFIKNYLFKLGFLDGRMGFFSARMSGFYTFLKYSRLHELHTLKHKN
jgi:glycosyltransferase involved in cell wall biosynthesis